MTRRLRIAVEVALLVALVPIGIITCDIRLSHQLDDVDPTNEEMLEAQHYNGSNALGHGDIKSQEAHH